MKFGFKFSNLCGTVYRQGNLLFTPDGNSLISPVGNRVTVFDLVNNTSQTLAFENRKNIQTVVLSPNGATLLTIDEDGHAILANFRLGVALHHFNFKAPVAVAKFSPDGKYFAVSHGKQIQVWNAPGSNKEFAPFVLHRTYTGHYDDVVAIDWSPDSRFFITGSNDMTARIYSLHPIDGFRPLTLTGHRNHVVAVFFSADAEKVYTISKDGALFIWRNVMAETHAIGWHLEERKYFAHNHAKVMVAAFHKASSLLTVGFSSGIFGLYELPDFNDIHTLSISQKRITAVAVNSTGEWLAFGSAKLGQLLVWEWKSESYVLKQQGHFYDLNVVAYSPDGQLIATGGDDGKVKIWNTRSGFCFVTFTEHSGGITGLRFSHTGHAVYSASLDGTVRGYDLIRYRNFRTFTSPSPTQFSCLAIDAASEVICAGTRDTFEIFVWSVQTGRLLEILAGHEGPVTSLAFNPVSAVLCSGSWDHEIRVWDVFERQAATEALPHTTDVLAFAFHPSGNEICVATLDGQLTFWDVANGKQTGSIEGRRDIAGGRALGDKVTAANSGSGKCFTSLCYSADGSCVIAGGRSKYVCIYEVQQKVLLKRFKISENRSLDGMLEKLNSKFVKDGENVELISDDEPSDLEDRLDSSLPGVQKGDLSKRRVRPEVRTKGVQFSPTGRAWAAATTEGLLIYSLDDTMVFDPFDLDIDVTPDNVKRTLKNREFAKALSLAFRLNERPLVKLVVEQIPFGDISLVVQTLPASYVDKLLTFIGSELDVTSHIEFYLTWSFHILNLHGKYLKDNSNKFMPAFRTLQKSVTEHNNNLARMCDDNTYTIQFVQSMAGFAGAGGESSVAMDTDGAGFGMEE